MIVYERYDGKSNLKKFLIYSGIALAVIGISALGGVWFVKSYNAKAIAKINNINQIVNQNMLEENVEDQDSGEEEQEMEEVKPKELSFPVYGENAKNNMENIYKADSDEKIAYLTFDDGPSSNITPQILQTLENENIKATFFVLGSRVDLYPNLVKQEYDAGHYIANHGYSHDYKSVYSSAQAIIDEFNRTESAIQKAIEKTDYHSYLFRFPGGSEGGKYSKVKDAAKKVLTENNIAYINWNALTRDAEGKPTKESIINDLKSTAEGKNRIVVLMHDAGTKQLTADTLPEVIAYLRGQGYTFKNFYDIMCE